MARIQLSDTYLEVQVQGAGDALVLCPGLAGLGSFWERQVLALSQEFKVIAYDHRGCGASSPDLVDYSVASMANDVIALMDELDIPRVALIGHSTGGAIGQYLAARHPDRISALVLSCSWDRCDGYFDQLFRLRRRVLIELGHEAHSLLGTFLLYPPKHLGAHPELLSQRITAPADAQRYVEIGVRRIDAIRQFDSTADLPRVTAPTLVIGADDDAVTPVHFSHRLAGSIAGARLSVFRDGGHYCPITRADAYNGVLLDFLRTVFR